MKDVAAEEAMLASVWLSGDVAMIARLDDRDFVDPFCRWLFEVLYANAEAGEPLDMVAVMRRARRPEVAAKLPGDMKEDMAYRIAKVLQSVSTSAHLDYYFRVLRTERLNRAIAALGDEIGNKLERKTDPRTILEFVMTNAEKLLERAR